MTIAATDHAWEHIDARAHACARQSASRAGIVRFGLWVLVLCIR